VQAGGGDPAWWIRHLAGRLEVVHLKDMAYDNGRVMTPVGEGNMNFETILAACRDAGTEWLMVEQDTCVGSPFDCLRSSYDYLSRFDLG
jgi:sugar phosphate isomerase/epimerase